MKGIDIALFDYDRHNAIYFFILNADEQIYLRYGGRDAASADSYLDLDSLKIALRKGLELHERWQAGELPAPERPEPLYPREIELLAKKEIASGRCVECHMIGDYQAATLEQAGELDKRLVMFPSPDLKTLGIVLDVPRGLVVESAHGAAAEAGITSGDTIVGFEGEDVNTFGDLQYLLGKLPRDAETTALSISRVGDEIVELSLQLPKLWWVTDIGYRYWSIDPQYFFESKQLSPEDRADLDLPNDALACEITKINRRSQVLELHDLRVGDVIMSVDAERSGQGLDSCELYLKIHVTAGETVELEVLREGETIVLPLKTHRQYYRKSK